MLQPQNTLPVRPFSNLSAKMSAEDNSENFSHNEHQSEDEQRRDETRAGGGERQNPWRLCGNRRGEPLLWRARLFVSSCSRREYRSNYRCMNKRLADNRSDISIRCRCTRRIYIQYGDVQKSALTRCWWVWLWWQRRDDFKVWRWKLEMNGTKARSDRITSRPRLHCNVNKDGEPMRELTFPKAS